MKLLKKIRIFFWYHFSAKEKSFDDPIMRYVPDVLFERNASMYLVTYNKVADSYTVLLQTVDQRFDV